MDANNTSLLGRAVSAHTPNTGGMGGGNNGGSSLYGSLSHSDIGMRSTSTAQ